jgi:hypothetical protein
MAGRPHSSHEPSTCHPVVREIKHRNGARDWSLFELFGYAHEAGEVGRRHPPAVSAQPIRAAEIE